MSRSISVLTQGEYVPSTRFRWTQYRNYISSSDYDIIELHSKFGAYPPSNNFSRINWAIHTFGDSFKRVNKSNDSDIVFLQRNLISNLYTFERFIKVPYIFDVDDAIFLGKFSNSQKVAQRAIKTICGNDYLADYFSRYGDVSILPTAVDCTRFVPSASKSSRKIIIWSGTESNFKYLYKIEAFLYKVFSYYPSALLRVVADTSPRFSLLKKDNFEFIKWSPSTEVKSIQESYIGIMPLFDDDWSRGKCSLKMLTYLACGLPVVVSPIGHNNNVLSMCGGFGATTPSQWVDSIIYLLDDECAAAEYGKLGRDAVVKNYSTEVIGPRLIKILNSIN